MSQCNHGCSRDSLIREVVTFQLGISDSARDLLNCIGRMRDDGVEPDTIDSLLRCHANMCEPLARYENHTFDLLAEHRARKKTEAA